MVTAFAILAMFNQWEDDLPNLIQARGPAAEGRRKDYSNLTIQMFSLLTYIFVPLQLKMMI